MRPIVIIFLGLFAGILGTFFPQLLLVLAAAIASIFIIRRYFKIESSGFLQKLFVYGLTIRIILLMLHHFLGLVAFYHSGDTQPDATIYNANAAYITSVIRGQEYLDNFIVEPFVAESVKTSYVMHQGTIPAYGTYQYGTYVYCLGLFYALFGYAPLAIKLLNSIFGCWSAIIVYLIANLMTRSPRSARMAAIVTMFFPSMILWSITMLQDTLVNLLFLLLSLFSLSYLSEQKRRMAFYAIPILVLLGLFKPKISILFWAAFLVILAIDFIRRLLRARLLARIGLLAFGGFVSSMLFFSQFRNMTKFLTDAFYATINIHKITVMSYSSAASFKIYSDSMYASRTLSPAGFMGIGMPIYALKGLLYYFLSPFPWYVPYTHPFLLLFYCQVVFTFICLPFMFIGIFSLFRRNALAMYSMLAFLFILIMPQAMSEGVIGTVARHRDMFMPFIFILSCYGFCQKILVND